MIDRGQQNCFVNTEIMIVNTSLLPLSDWRLFFYFFASERVKFAARLRSDSPFSSSR